MSPVVASTLAMNARRPEWLETTVDARAPVQFGHMGLQRCRMPYMLSLRPSQALAAWCSGTYRRPGCCRSTAGGGSKSLYLIWSDHGADAALFLSNPRLNDLGVVLRRAIQPCKTIGQFAAEPIQRFVLAAIRSSADPKPTW